MKKTYSFLLGTALLLGVAGSASAKINWNATVNSSNYDYGDSLTVNWTPKLPGVSTIQMVSATDEKGALGMYGQLVFGDPTNTKGTFTYDFPAYRVVPAGEYKIKLFPANGDDPFYSPKFTIDSPNGTSIKQEKQQFNIKKITGLKKKHAADSSLSLEIQAFEYAKVPADRLNGFNVQVSISDPLLPYAGYLQNENAEYDSAKKVWKVGLKVPSDARTYELKAVLYCADFSFNSYCAQKYGDSKSFEKKMKFRVEAKNSKKTKSKIIVLSPNGGEVITDTSNIPIAWMLPNDNEYFTEFYLMPSKKTPLTLTNPQDGIPGWYIGGNGFGYHPYDPTVRSTIWSVGSIPDGEYKLRAYLHKANPDYNFKAKDALDYDESDKYFRIKTK